MCFPMAALSTCLATITMAVKSVWIYSASIGLSQSSLPVHSLGLWWLVLLLSVYLQKLAVHLCSQSQICAFLWWCLAPAIVSLTCVGAQRLQVRASLFFFRIQTLINPGSSAVPSALVLLLITTDMPHKTAKLTLNQIRTCACVKPIALYYQAAATYRITHSTVSSPLLSPATARLSTRTHVYPFHSHLPSTASFHIYSPSHSLPLTFCAALSIDLTAA